MPYIESSRSSGVSSASANGSSNDHDVAIIGLACRFAGDATDAEHFWDLLCSARSAYSDTDRFNAKGFYDNGEKKLNCSSTQGGHFLRQDVAAFDANFFNISRNEALAIDPQQRLMLEVAYEAFENAGLPIETLAGTQMGCYVGNFTTDYREMIFRDPEAAPLYSVTGTGVSMISNRISFFYDLKGPSFTVNTACSSGLVALHQAAQSIRSGESTTAIVGGSNLILSPEMFMFFSNQKFLARDGLCKSFDASGDGYSRGEGVAAIILKPVSDAIRDGDPIRAILRGTGVNQNGKTKGITLPSAEAQADLIRSTYHAAGLDFKDTGFLEAHGTGTKAGDPLELEAAAKTLAAVRESYNKLIVGSSKANIGHTEATAGLAGLIKGIYILEKGIIPPNIHFHKPNPAIPFDDWKVTVPTKAIPWPTSGIRRISVNSFGYSGTNAHAIIDDACSYLKERGLTGIHFTQPSKSIKVNGGITRTKSELWMPGLANNFNATKSKNEPASKKTRLFVFSAQDQDGLTRQKESFSQYLRQSTRSEGSSKEKYEYLRDLAFTLSEKRSRLPWKTYATASSLSDLASKLESKEPDSLSCRSMHEPRLGFVFTGQGAQWAKMGIELCHYKVFRESVEQADEYLRTKLGCPWSAIEELHCDEADSNINLPAYSQSLCTVLQVALVDLLESWNITPCAVTGHSSGEIAGAYCLGALSKEDAWKIAYYRGLLSSQMPSHDPTLKGAMMAVGTSESEAEKWISRLTKGDVGVACVNSPSSVTISGDESAIDELHDLLKKEDIFARKLKVETAYHSHHMNVIATPYLQAINDIQILPARDSCQMFSAVAGGLADATELGPVNWVRNLVSPVQFSDACYELLRPFNKDGKRSTENAVDILLEVGPHSALQGPVKEIMEKYNIKNIDYRSVVLRHRNGVDTALAAAGALFAQGVPVDVNAVNRDTANALDDSPRPLINLPAYRWNHSRTYWGESRISKQYRLREQPPRSLIGAPCPVMGEGERMWRGFLRISEDQWIRDHKIQTSILYPAAGYIAMAIEGARQMAETGRQVRDFKLRDIQISSAALVSEESDLECIFQIRPHLIATRDKSSTWFEFTVSTCPDGQDLRQNCCGLIIIEYESTADSPMDVERRFEDQKARDLYNKAENSCNVAENPAEFYEELASFGLMYGPSFQKVSRIRKGTDQSCCVVETFNPHTHASSDRPHIIHPATLDAMFHAVFAAFKSKKGQLKEAMVPTAIDEVIVSINAPYENGTRFCGFSNASRHGFRELMADIVMLDEKTMQPSVMIKGFCCAAVSGMGGPADDSANETGRNMFSKLMWTPILDLLTLDQESQLIDSTIQGSLPADLTKKIEKTELMMFLFMRRACENVSLDYIPSQPLKNLYLWIKHQLDLASKNALPLQAVMDDWSATLQDVEEQLESEVDKIDSEGTLLCKLGRNLEHILCGKVKVTDLLSGTDFMDKNITEIRGGKEILEKLSELVNLTANIRPKISILELGNSTGGAVSTVLPSLSKHLEGIPNPADYTFSCLNTITLEKAKAQLKDFNNSITYKVLDVEKNLSSQGFESGTYDIIILSNMFATAQELDKVLPDLQKLLKRGGRLCALGLATEGLTTNTLLRFLPESPLDIELLATKLKPNYIVKDFEDSRYQHVNLFVATAENGEKQDLVNDEVFILQAPQRSERSAEISSHLTTQLKSRYVKVNNAEWGGDLSVIKGKRCISLLELEHPILNSLSKSEFAAFQKLILQSSSLLWVSSARDAAGSLASGLARTVRNEVPDMQFRTLKLQSESPDVVAPIIARLASASVADDEFVEEDGILKVSRIVEDAQMDKLVLGGSSTGEKDDIESMPLKDCKIPQKLAILNQGMLDSLCYEGDSLPSLPLADDEVEIDVKASGLNFRDIMVAMGHIPDSTLGFEASGIVRRIGDKVTKFNIGDRVCTLGLGAHRSVFRNKEAFVQLIPANLTFEEAATIPLVHCTAYNALVRIAHAEPGQTVLIHAAAGGVGQVAVQIAKHIGMQIFATVGSPDKRKLLREVYGIPDNCIFNSRDVSFAKGIKRLTNGRGVDVVLNSLSGEALRETWHCIAPFGTFIEIGMKDILSNTGLDMRPFLQDATFAFFNLSHVLKDNPKLMARIIEDTFDFLRKGITKPVTPLKVYPISQVEDAFRLMQTGKHRGKISLSWDQNAVIPVLRSNKDTLKLDSDAAYLLVGGLGGIGRSLANFLVDNGARRLCFISRSGADSPRAQKLIKDLENRRVVTQIYRCDVNDSASVSSAISNCTKSFAPIRGVIQCAMVLRDILFEKMSYTDWTESLSPKVSGTRNLSNFLPRELDFFITLSSFAGIFGNRTQSNYAAAGAFQDALAHHRRSQGLKAVTIDLGVMRDVGVIAEHGATDYLKEWEEPFGVREQELHALIGHIISSEMSEDGQFPAQVLTGFATGGAAAKVNIRRPIYFDDPRFSLLSRTGLSDTTSTTAASPSTATKAAAVTLSASLAAATSMSAATELVTTALVAKVAKSLQTSPEEIDTSRPLHSFGVDSLVAVEIRNWIFRDAKSNVSLFDVLSAVPITALAAKIATKCKVLKEGISKD